MCLCVSHSSSASRKREDAPGRAREFPGAATHYDATALWPTLVVSLPSAFRGGAMMIRHYEEELVVGGSGKHLTLIAFYADCQHEVRPIRLGYRIGLTYDLLVEGERSSTVSVAEGREALGRSIRRFFATLRPLRWHGDRREGPPDRLVYLLDHEYTQRGLAWNRLKNADAHRVAALQAVARRLDCETCLALADVHETWSCEEEYAGYRVMDAGRAELTVPSPPISGRSKPRAR